MIPWQPLSRYIFRRLDLFDFRSIQDCSWTKIWGVFRKRSRKKVDFVGFVLRLSSLKRWRQCWILWVSPFRGLWLSSFWNKESCHLRARVAVAATVISLGHSLHSPDTVLALEGLVASCYVTYGSVRGRPGCLRGLCHACRPGHHCSCSRCRAARTGPWRGPRHRSQPATSHNKSPAGYVNKSVPPLRITSSIAV